MPVKIIVLSDFLVSDLPEILSARGDKFVSRGNTVWIYEDISSNSSTQESVVTGGLQKQKDSPSLEILIQ